MKLYPKLARDISSYSSCSNRHKVNSVTVCYVDDGLKDKSFVEAINYALLGLGI